DDDQPLQSFPENACRLATADRGRGGEIAAQRHLVKGSLKGWLESLRHCHCFGLRKKQLSQETVITPFNGSAWGEGRPGPPEDSAQHSGQRSPFSSSWGAMNSA